MNYRSAQERQKRLKRLEKETRHSYGAGAFYDDQKKRIVRYSCHNKKLKKHCRREMRRRLKNLDYCSRQKCDYKKLYDYWWELL